jgi:outer membrane lipopolysaccharide assembly protein LptE/RlpB
MRKAAGFGAVVLAALTLASCGYRLRGTGNLRDVLPAHVKKIAIPLFKNRTTRFELDKNLTNGVIDEFIARGKVEIVTDPAAADAVLTGEIAVFNATPAAYTPGKGTADRYTVTVVTMIELKDSQSKAVIYANPAFSYTEDYEVPQGKDFDSVQTEAVKKIAVKFARQLVITILEGF